jgi:glycosyltransferase involved in cell wall biosynthesis
MRHPASITIAAIIPLYNGAPFIREALESVLRQTVPPDEIIVVDDGSTDDGPTIVEELSRSRQIRLLRKANGGQSSARNLAVETCGSSHLAFLDQDDAWYENHLEVLKRPFEEGGMRNLALVYGNLDQIDRNGRMVCHGCLDTVPTPHPKRSLLDCLRHDMFILPGASLVDKAAFMNVGRFDDRLSGYEDDDLFVRLFSGGYQSIYLNVSITRWRIYAGSTSYSDRMRRSRMIYFRKLLEQHPDDPLLEVYWGRDAIGPRFMRLVAGDFLSNLRRGDLVTAERAWTNVLEVAASMRRRTRRRLRIVSPLISILFRMRFVIVPKLLLRYAIY